MARSLGIEFICSPAVDFRYWNLHRWCWCRRLDAAWAPTLSIGFHNHWGGCLGLAWKRFHWLALFSCRLAFAVVDWIHQIDHYRTRLLHLLLLASHRCPFAFSASIGQEALACWTIVQLQALEINLLILHLQIDYSWHYHDSNHSLFYFSASRLPVLSSWP